MTSMPTDALAPSESVALSVTVWVPEERSLRLSEPPVPIVPSWLDDQARDDPERGPSSGSVALPSKVIDAPAAKVAPSCGALIAGAGDWFGGGGGGGGGGAGGGVLPDSDPLPKPAGWVGPESHAAVPARITRQAERGRICALIPPARRAMRAHAWFRDASGVALDVEHRSPSSGAPSDGEFRKGVAVKVGGRRRRSEEV